MKEKYNLDAMLDEISKEDDALSKSSQGNLILSQDEIKNMLSKRKSILKKRKQNNVEEKSDVSTSNLEKEKQPVRPEATEARLNKYE
jgi:hypothetical protein